MRVVPPVVATIGVFDGVHRGHRALFEVVRQRARALGALSLAITFDPHPVTVLGSGGAPHLLTSRRIKMRLFAELGLDLAWALPFSRELAAMEPEAFVHEVLLSRIELRELWVGYDFRFGRGRSGELGLLRRIGRERGFEAHQFGPVHEGGRVLSSSWVREVLRSGDLAQAERVLGHGFFLEAPVGRGRGEGTRLLVPTANLHLPPEQLLPAHGVYAMWAEAEGRLVPAVANIGVRPTLTSGEAVAVEVHLIGYSGDLRGRILPVHFAERLREERRFDGLAALREAVAEDVRTAAARLAGRLPVARPAPPEPGGCRQGTH